MFINKLTGLEMMQMMVSGDIPRASITETMGIYGGKAEKGYFELSIKPDERHINPLGIVHGGFYSTALDSVTGCAIHTELGPGDFYSTLDLNVKFLKRIDVNQELKAIGNVIKISKRIGVSEGKIIDAEGNLYAHATATCLITSATK